MGEQRGCTVSDVLAVVEEFYPLERAASWDVVGLTVGSRHARVTHCHWAVDPTDEVVEEAARVGAEVLITHHPLLLKGATSLCIDAGKGRTVALALQHGVALICAHTNADASTPGVNDALAAACGLSEYQALSPDGHDGLGQWGQLPEPTTVQDFCTQLAQRLPAAPVGLRVSGPLDAPVRTVAVVGGAGDSFFADAARVHADVYVTADLRHHPVLEQRSAQAGGPPYVIDAGHWATESLWLGHASERMVQRLSDLGWSITSSVSTLCTDPWTAVFPTQDIATAPAEGSPLKGDHS